MQTKWTRLTDDQWEVIKPFVNHQRKRTLDLRDVFDAIFYITRTGCQWRNLPDEFGKWSAVYYYFDKWTKQGVLMRINLALNQIERQQRGRKPLASMALADSQSIKLAPMIYEYRGTDGFKKVNGRKRHILTDVLGRVYCAHVHAANEYDGNGGVALVDQLEEWMKGVETVLADQGYQGVFAEAVTASGRKFALPKREEGQKGFVVQAKRWVVERTFAWLNFYRRVAMDYEHTPRMAASFVIMANISMVLAKVV